jgi:hypothetical protein
MPSAYHDPTKAAEARRRYEHLQTLFPRGRIRAWIEENIAAMPPDETVILPGMSAEELEAEMEEVLALPPDAPPDVAAELAKMKQLFRDTRGKKISELPVSPEALVAEYEEETETAIAGILSAWMNVLHFARKHSPPGSAVRLSETLEPVTSVRFGHAGTTSWVEMACTNTALTPIQATAAHAEFASRLRPLIDGAPDGYVLWDDEHVIARDVDGYLLPARK